MKKIVSSLIAGLMAVSLVMMGCSNDSSSDNSALMLLGGSGNGSGASGGTAAPGGAVKALADAQTGDTVDFSTYKFSDKIALTVDKAITVKNANLKGGYITLSEAAILDNVDGGTIVLVGNGKNATLKDCDAKNVIIKESAVSRMIYGFTLRINGGVIENFVNSDWDLTIEAAKITIKKLITNKSLVINSTDDSKIDLIAAENTITLVGKLVAEKVVSEHTVYVASNSVNIKKGMVEIEASELAEGGLDIEAIKAAVGELTESEGAAILSTVEALQSEVAEIGAKIEAAEEEAKKALEEYEKEQAAKAFVTVYLVQKDHLSPANKVPLAEIENFIEEMLEEMPDGVEIEFFADKNCTTVIDVKALKAGDSVYIKVTANIPEGPIVPEATSLYSGSFELKNVEDYGLDFDAGELGNNNVLGIMFTSGSGAAYAKIAYFNPWSDLEDEDFEVTSDSASKSTSGDGAIWFYKDVTEGALTVVLSPDAVAALNTYGFRIYGDGATIYKIDAINMGGDPIIPGGDLENNVVIETTDESGASVTLEETLGEVAEGYHTGVFYVTGYKATAATSMAYAKLFDVTGTDWVQLAQVQVTGNGAFSFPRFNVTGDNANVVVQVWGRAVSFNLSNFATAPTSAPDGLLDGFVFSGEMNAWGAGELAPMGDKEYIFTFTATKDSYQFAIQDGSWNSKYCGGVVVTEGVITELPSGGENAKIEGLEAGNTYAVIISEVNNKVKVLVVNDDI